MSVRNKSEKKNAGVAKDRGSDRRRRLRNRDKNCDDMYVSVYNAAKRYTSNREDVIGLQMCAIVSRQQ